MLGRSYTSFILKPMSIKLSKLLIYLKKKSQVSAAHLLLVLELDEGSCELRFPSLPMFNRISSTLHGS